MSPLSEGGVPDGHAPQDEHHHHHNELDPNMNMQHQNSQQNGAHDAEGISPISPANGPGKESGIDTPKPSGERNRSRTRAGRTPSGNIRLCKKCGEPLTGQFVRALGGTFHLECFKCRVCISTCDPVSHDNG